VTGRGETTVPATCPGRPLRSTGAAHTGQVAADAASVTVGDGHARSDDRDAQHRLALEGLPLDGRAQAQEVHHLVDDALILGVVERTANNLAVVAHAHPQDAAAVVGKGGQVF
jgi:hypothetical protein